MNTVAVAIPHLADNGSVIVIGSTAALVTKGINTTAGSGGDGYSWAKRSLAEYVEHMAVHLAPGFIRVNAIHPTNCNTTLLKNDALYSVFRPDLDDPQFEDVEPLMRTKQAMPIPYIEPEDVAHLVLFLASDESRYITGQQIRVDAGGVLIYPE